MRNLKNSEAFYDLKFCIEGGEGRGIYGLTDNEA